MRILTLLHVGNVCGVFCLTWRFWRRKLLIFAPSFVQVFDDIAPSGTYAEFLTAAFSLCRERMRQKSIRKAYVGFVCVIFWVLGVGNVCGKAAYPLSGTYARPAATGVGFVCAEERAQQVPGVRNVCAAGVMKRRKRCRERMRKDATSRAYSRARWLSPAAAECLCRRSAPGCWARPS